MKNRITFASFGWLIAGLFLLAFAPFLAAQPAAAAAPVAAPAVAASGIGALITGLVPVLTPFFSLAVTWIVKAVAPHIPGYLFPVIAGVVGMLPDYVNHLATGAASNPIMAAVLGLAATGIHQISAQLKPAAPAEPAKPAA